MSEQLGGYFPDQETDKKTQKKFNKLLDMGQEFLDNITPKEVKEEALNILLEATNNLDPSQEKYFLEKLEDFSNFIPKDIKEVFIYIIKHGLNNLFNEDKQIFLTKINNLPFDQKIKIFQKLSPLLGVKNPFN